MIRQTSNSLGKSEEILGRALKEYAKRDEVVIATKVHQKMREGPNGGGLPYCRDQGIALTPYSPLASGRLTRAWSVTTKRLEADEMAKSKYDSTADADRLVVERVAEIAKKCNIPRVYVALAWLLQKKPVVAPVIGATKMSHIKDAVAALDTTLAPDEVAYLEEPYVPHKIIGHV